MRRVLDRAAETVFRSRLKMPVDVYEGPAMNHSYHEMIIGHGHCFSTVLLSEERLRCPKRITRPTIIGRSSSPRRWRLPSATVRWYRITVKDLDEASLDGARRVLPPGGALS